MIADTVSLGNLTQNVSPEKIKATAEEYYRSGDFFCSEAIVKTIKDAFDPLIPDTVIAAVSGFPVGMGGAGCTCGAVAGGIVALGLFFGRTEPKDEKIKRIMELSRELHDAFRFRHKRLCCRILTKGMTFGSQEHMEQCIAFTGEVAEEVSRMIVREQTKQQIDEKL